MKISMPERHRGSGCGEVRRSGRSSIREAPDSGVVGVVLGFRGQVADEEFLQQVGDGGFADSDQCVVYGQSQAVAILGRIVKVGNTAGSHASQDAGVIGLPALVVALADY